MTGVHAGDVAPAPPRPDGAVAAGRRRGPAAPGCSTAPTRRLPVIAATMALWAHRDTAHGRPTVT